MSLVGDDKELYVWFFFKRNVRFIFLQEIYTEANI